MSIGMPGSVPSMAVQKKQSVVPPSQGPLSTRTIQSQRKGRPTEENGSIVKTSSETSGGLCSVNKSNPLCSQLSPRAAAGSTVNGLNVDERLKAARERREEHQRLLASRELSRLERDRRARRFHEQQLQERRKKLLEQRLKEERRRAAVEEKRKQRQREERERHESAVRRTLEKSQKAQQNQSQVARGRKLTKNVSRRSPLSAWEANLVRRLLTPTCSYLARSRSAGVQSGQEVSFHSTNTTTHKPQHQPGPAHHRSPNGTQQRGTSLAQIKAAREQQTIKKSSPGNSNVRSTPAKPAALRRKTPASPERRTPHRPVGKHSPPPPLQLELPAVPEEDANVWASALSPGNTRPGRRSGEGRRESPKEASPAETPRPKPPDTERRDGDGSPMKMSPQAAEGASRPSAGTTDPNEASRLLAEKRKEARLQREKEEQERLQREEAERRSREDLERRRAEERARQQAEAQQLIEEKRRREEEEQRRAEEERAQAMREAALLQKQREEEQAKEKVRAEQLKQEREVVAQKEEADRQARKKRLEEIMRRTRRSDSPDTKPAPARISPDEAGPKENAEPGRHLNGDGVLRTAQIGLNHLRQEDEDMVPVVAFKERRSLRTLSGLEEIQTHQRAEVI